MSKKIMNEASNEEVDLCIKQINIDFHRIGNQGMQFLCSQSLSHATKLVLSKTIENKLEIKSVKRGCFIYPEIIGGS
jgi:hypothetical protein